MPRYPQTYYAWYNSEVCHFGACVLVYIKMDDTFQEKWSQVESLFKWDDDPLVFIYHKEIPGKVKMMTHRLNMKDWIKIDKTYAGSANSVWRCKIK